jgi:hypothetical protein
MLAGMEMETGTAKSGVTNASMNVATSGAMNAGMNVGMSVSSIAITAGKPSIQVDVELR